MVDLHVHSTCSDGTFTPEELVDYAMKRDCEPSPSQIMIP